MAPDIAVVDDDEAVLDSIGMLLRGQGWCVHLFADGRKFLQQLHAGLHLDCLLLDPNLPGMNGAQVAHEVHALCSLIPIVGITARPNSPLAHATSRAGARVMLTKPIPAEKLLKVVGSSLPDDSAADTDTDTDRAP